MNQPTSPPRAEGSKLARLEPYARNGLLGFLVAMALVMVGQYTGASAVAAVMQRERMAAWAARSAAHSAAMAAYLACDKKGPAVTKQACVERDAKGDLAAELDDVTTTPKAVWEALPGSR